MLSNTIRAVLMLGFVGAAHAGTFYTDLDSFTSALSGPYYLETFNSRPFGEDAASINFSGSGFSYTATPFDTVFYNAGSPGDVWLSTNHALRSVTFTFTSGNVTAVGGYFFPSNISGAVAPGNITLTFSDGGTTTLTNPTSSTFTGYISSTVLTSLVQTPSADGNVWSTTNDLYVGAGAAPVPEPSAFLLSAGGLLVAFVRLRRKR